MHGQAPRRKGLRFEREVVDQASRLGLEAERSWGSDGRSRGLPANVDVVVRSPIFGEVYLQCKRRRAVPHRLEQVKTAHEVFRVRTSQGVCYLLWYTTLLEILAGARREVVLSEPRGRALGATWHPTTHVLVFRANRSVAKALVSETLWHQLTRHLVIYE